MEDIKQLTTYATYCDAFMTLHTIVARQTGKMRVGLLKAPTKR